MTPLIRWSIFLFIGLPFQFLFYPIYVVLHILYWFTVRPYFYNKDKTTNAHIERDTQDPQYYAIRDSSFHDNGDDHGALTQYGFWRFNPEKALDGLTKLVHESGSLLRQYRNQYTRSYYVSGDVVVSWCFALELSGVGHKMKDTVNKVCLHYLKNLGTISHEDKANGWVSARCNNFGINYCPDGFLGLGQPAAGPQFYTSSCLFAIGCKYGSWYWKPVFWVHWLLMGGWFWCWSPVIHPRSNLLGYVRDITMKALWVHNRVFPDSLWVIYPIIYITYKISSCENALFYAMCGFNVRRPLPQVSDPWFSQRIDGNCDSSSEHANIWISAAVNEIRKDATIRYRP